jgi:AraC-like DNA-binding protein
MPFNLWDILILVSLAQGLLFGLAILSSSSYKKSPARYLAYSIIMTAIIGGNEWLSGWDFDDQYYLIDLLGDDVPWILLFYVPMWLYFVKTSGHPLQNSPRLGLLLLPFLLFLLLNLLIDGDVDFHLYDLPGVRRWMAIVYAAEYWLALFFTLFLLIWAHIILDKMKGPQTSKKWLMRIWSATAMLVGCWLLLSLIPESALNRYERLDYGLWGGVSIFIYWLTYKGLLQFRLSEEQRAIRILSSQKQREGEKSTIPDGSDQFIATQPESAYMEQLDKLVREKKIHTNPDLSRDDVAQMLGISAGYLSQIISTSTEGNFSSYINQKRIEEVKKMLSNADFNQYSLLAIGREAGFRSKSAFYTTFKKHTGMTPSAFKKSTHSSTSDNSAPQ